MPNSVHIPDLFKPRDQIIYRLTSPTDYRIPFTLVEALNQGNLFDRSGRVFAEAARAKQLYEVMVSTGEPEDERIIGTGMFQETFRERNSNHHRYELGALMVHPGARGYGVMTLLVKLMMAHRFAVVLPVRGKQPSEEDIAHVLDGNSGPIPGLLAAGFEAIGEIHMHSDEFDGVMSHMMRPGEDFVRFHAYRFNASAVWRLCDELLTFQDQGGRLGNDQTPMTLPVDFSTLINPNLIALNKSNERYQRQEVH